MAGTLGDELRRRSWTTSRSVASRPSAARTDESNSAISNTADAARDAVDSAEKVHDSVNGAILHSIKVRPYTTLAIAGLIGFAYGALRR